jgi:hypothetical protein
LNSQLTDIFSRLGDERRFMFGSVYVVFEEPAFKAQLTSNS